MKINPISFGKRIPLNDCKILDTHKSKLVGATFCEYDCKDILDICEIGELGNSYPFKELVAVRMLEKFKCNQEGLELNEDHFYSLVDYRNKVVGFCYCQEGEKEIAINIISSDTNKKYKYVGSSIIASLGEKLLNTNANVLKVKSPISDAYGFYEKCGFKYFEEMGDVYSRSCEMQKSDVIGFLERFKDKIWMILFGL